jgi:single-strand DNA-binding protein
MTARGTHREGTVFMAEGLNRVLLLGNLGADPELKMTPSGQAVLKMRLATSESYLDRNRVRQERTEWHAVVVWGKRAEALAKFLTKGSSLFIEGSLRTSSYEGKDGVKRYKTEVNARNILLTGSGRSGGGGGGGRGGPPEGGERAQGPRGGGGAEPPPDFADAPLPDDGADGGFPDDDIPF